MKVINLFGGPGSGKSVTAAGLFYRMKLLGLNVEIVTEYAKDLLYSDRLKSMVGYQEVIYAEQFYRLHRLDGNVDYAVTDSPLLLSAVYPDVNRELYNIKPWPALGIFKEFVRKQFAYYDNFNIWLDRPDSFQSEGRLHDIKESLFIDSYIKSELSMHKITPVKVDDDIIDNILELLGLVDK